MTASNRSLGCDVFKKTTLNCLDNQLAIAKLPRDTRAPGGRPGGDGSKEGGDIVATRAKKKKSTKKKVAKKTASKRGSAKKSTRSKKAAASKKTVGFQVKRGLTPRATRALREAAEAIWAVGNPKPHALLQELHETLLLRCLDEADGNYAGAAALFGPSRQSVQQYANSPLRDTRWKAYQQNRRKKRGA